METGTPSAFAAPPGTSSLDKSNAVVAEFIQGTWDMVNAGYAEIGWSSDGTLITVTGSGFDLNQLRLRPLIGGSACTSVRLAQLGVLTCTSPPLANEQAAGVPLPFAVGLHVTERADELPLASESTPSSFARIHNAPPPTFTYYASPIVLEVRPAVGPVDGGITISQCAPISKPSLSECSH